ncbi:hypothetical protein JT06_05845 [Desulfobulbus sp. Tol-SR]|nr:hypothetical protein JT06_05845 [Desulfobulbus sp. Tol-SR]
MTVLRVGVIACAAADGNSCGSRSSRIFCLFLLRGYVIREGKSNQDVEKIPLLFSRLMEARS